jgi:hypothetical protein
MENDEIKILAKELAIRSLSKLIVWAIGIFATACLSMTIFYFRTTEAVPKIESRLNKLEEKSVTKDELQVFLMNVKDQLSDIKQQQSDIKQQQVNIYQVLINRK